MRIAPVIGVVAAMFAWEPSTAGPRQPTGPWQVHYDDTQCVASREYGSESKPLTLTLIPSATGAAMRILFVRAGRVDQRQEPAKLELGSEKPIDTYSFIYDVPEKNHRVISLNVPMSQFRAAASSETIGVATDEFEERLSVNLLPQLLTALDTCLVDLRKAWNITLPLPEATAVMPGLPAIFTTKDYPAVAQYSNLSGDVGVSILIDETGKVADCSVDKPSGVAILDTVTCYVIQTRAHFPAPINGDLKPIRTALSETVRWQLAPQRQ